ncbi:MAG: hypothetical protein ACTHLN_16565 [Tepidisphaeraceae bacterium]
MQRIPLINFILSSGLFLVSAAVILGYAAYTKYVFAHQNGTINFRVPFVLALLVCIVDTALGLMFATFQFRTGSSETERALAILPMTAHGVVAVCIALVFAGFDVVAL